MADHQEWLSIADVAGVLKVGEPTVEQLIERGALHAQQEGESLRVSHASLLEFLRADQQTLESGKQPPDIAALPPTDL